MFAGTEFAGESVVTIEGGVPTIFTVALPVHSYGNKVTQSR